MCVSMCGCTQQECGYSERPEVLCLPRAGITDSCSGLDRGAGIELRSSGGAVHALDRCLSSSLMADFKLNIGSFKICNVVSALLGFTV